MPGQERRSRKARNEGIARRRDEVRRRSELQDPTLADDADPVRERGGVLEVVGDEHGGQPERLEQLAQFGADARPRVRVERGERLVQQEDLRIACERSRERNALALSARELRDACVREMGDPEALEHGVCVRLVTCAEAHVARHVEVRE